MKTTFDFNLAAKQLTGPAGSLDISPTDHLARRFLMLVEGQCFQHKTAALAAKYGCCRQRYYQLLELFRKGGVAALQPQKSGPRSNYRRTDQVVRQVLRYLFLDPEASPEVIVQKLQQTHLNISLRSVQRIIADYGLQKKTLRPESRPGKSSAQSGRAKRSALPAVGLRRPAQRRTGDSSTTGR